MEKMMLELKKTRGGEEKLVQIMLKPPKERNNAENMRIMDYFKVRLIRNTIFSRRESTMKN